MARIKLSSVLISLIVLFGALSSGAAAQNRPLKGTVKDMAGTPLIGVNVIQKGTTNGTVTDVDGNFSINVPANATIVFTYIGFSAQEVVWDGASAMNIVMHEDAELLEEIVVVGYGTQAKKDITGSVAVVDTKQLLASTGSSATQQLQGKTPGVYIGQTGSPGSATMVRIRGVNTINDNGPLYVIDGVSTRNQNLSSLNPNDIESMQVLKDASSAAIYGAQAANGVILITTKRGTGSGQPKLFYDAYFGMQKTGKRYDLLNSADRLAVEWESQQNSFTLRGVEGVPEHAQFGKGVKPTIPNYLTTKGADGRQDIDLNDYSFPNNQIVPFSDTDWWNAIDRVAPMQNHQLTFNGGGAKGRYLMGLNYFNQLGTVEHSFYKRYQTRINTSFDIRPWFRVGENLQYTWTKDVGLHNNTSESNPYSWVYRSSPWVPVKDTFGNWGGSKIAGTGNWVNVVAQEERNKDNYWSNSRIFGNIWAEVDLFPQLTYRTSFGLDYTNAYSYYMSKKNLEFSESPGTNHFQEASSFNFRWVWTNTLTYDKVFNDVHALNVIVGSEAIRDGLGRGMEARRYHYLLEDNTNTWVLAMGANDNQRTNNSWYNGEFALFGVFGRADYTYKDKYLFTGIVRRDGVSRFASKHRYGAFPSASIGWRVSEENFMGDTRGWLDDLKLRVGYGHTGNAEIPRATNFAMLFGTAPDRTNYDLGGTNTGSELGYRLATYGNEETRWEATKMTNIGVDITFGGNRFNSTLEFYNKVTSDMLISAAYSALANDEVGRPYINFGDMRNRGIDFSFNYRDKVGDLEWDLGVNLSTYKNKVLGLSTAEDYALWGSGERLATDVTRTTKGRPISDFFGYNIVGFYENEQDVLNSPVPYGTTKAAITENPGSYVGKFKFEDVSGPEGTPDGVINSYDRKVIGNPHPDLVGGLTTTLKYRSFDFTMFWYSTIGNDLFNNTKYFTDFPLFGGNRSVRFKDKSWKKGADNSKAKLPILDSKDNWGGAVASSYYVEDGSFLKLKNLVVGYTIPKRIVEKAAISNLRLYLQAENVLTLTKYSGLDPEITNMETGAGSGADLRRGLDAGGWPTTMRFLFGLNFEF
ncbi:MAG: TonB-dependent receptor [Proteiniphilum sp.]|nr:TonB-dependent receptor [Proteiniphilum sp.]MDD4799875.1 TonB-dependent receptor [Proteiniphilum sp.]